MAAMTLLIGGVGPVKAGPMTLYDNGPINGAIDAWTINFGFQVSNSFTLSQSSQVTGVQFGAWLIPGDAVSAVGWTISTGPTGDGVGDTNQPTGVIASGTAATTDSLFLPSNSFGDQLDEINFLLNVSLAPGTYYLSLQNAVVSNGDIGFWDQNNGPSTAYENTIGLLNGNNGLDPPGGSESFQIYGTAFPAVQTVPEPASLAIFGLMSAGGAVYFGRRSKTAEA